MKLYEYSNETYDLDEVISFVLDYIDKNNMSNDTRTMFLSSDPSDQVILYRMLKSSIDDGDSFSEVCIQWCLTEE